MGKISDAMQNVVDEIRSSTEARGTALRELSEETKQLIKDADSAMKDIHNVNQVQAKALRERLSSEEKARLEATQQFMEEVGIEVSEMCSGTHNLLERFHLEHGEMAKALREKLSSEEKARLEATRQFMEEVHKTNNQGRDAVREMLDEIGSDLRQAGQIWTKEVKIVPEAAAKKKEIKKKPAEEKEKILEVIARHPEGVKLIDIGNEMGVDWRTLIGSTKSLVDEDKVEKIDTIYYPQKEE